MPHTKWRDVKPVIIHTCNVPNRSVVLRAEVAASKRKRKCKTSIWRTTSPKRYKPPTLKGYVWYKLSHPQFSFFSVKNGKNKKSVGLRQFPCVLAFNCRTTDMHNTILSKRLQIQCLHAYLGHGKARKILIFVIRKERSSDRRGKIVTVMQLICYSINMHVCIPDFSKQWEEMVAFYVIFHKMWQKHTVKQA